MKVSSRMGTVSNNQFPKRSACGGHAARLRLTPRYCASIRRTDIAVNGDPLMLTCPASARAAEICRSESGQPQTSMQR
jgi:hypothetical protein